MIYDMIYVFRLISNSLKTLKTLNVSRQTVRTFKTGTSIHGWIVTGPRHF